MSAATVTGSNNVGGSENSGDINVKDNRSRRSTEELQRGE